MTTSSMKPAAEHGSLQGSGPLFRKEMGDWWSGRRWLVQALLWQIVINGLLIMVLFVLPSLLPDEAAANPVEGFFSIGSFALAIGVIVTAQSAVTTELETGTAEWLLAKPVARPTFILAKLAAHTIGMLVVMIFLPGAVAMILLALAGSLTVLPFLGGLAVLALHTFFYLTLTLMMGVLVRGRGAVLAVPLVILFGGQLALIFAALVSLGSVVLLTPWPLPNAATAIASAIPLSVQLLVPIVATAVWSILFVAVALWRFERLEL